MFILLLLKESSLSCCSAWPWLKHMQFSKYATCLWSKHGCQTYSTLWYFFTVGLTKIPFSIFYVSFFFMFWASSSRVVAFGVSLMGLATLFSSPGLRDFYIWTFCLSLTIVKPCDWAMERRLKIANGDFSSKIPTQNVNKFSSLVVCIVCPDAYYLERPG